MTRILDILFRVIGTEVPADHGYALFGALSRILESDCDRWLHGNAHIGQRPPQGDQLPEPMEMFPHDGCGRFDGTARWRMLPASCRN